MITGRCLICKEDYEGIEEFDRHERLHTDATDIRRERHWPYPHERKPNE